MSKILLAAVQMASSPNVHANLIEARRLIEMATTDGASFVVLPENFAFMGMAEADKLAIAEEYGAGPIQDFLAKTAERSKVWLVGGTLPIKASNGKVRSACLVFNHQGQRVGRYDKIHLFDVNVPGTEERYQESNTIDAGDEPVVLDTPFGRLGLSICYDLRFRNCIDRWPTRDWICWSYHPLLPRKPALLTGRFYCELVPWKIFVTPSPPIKADFTSMGERLLGIV